jgi:flagellar protein FliO/FliZ
MDTAILSLAPLNVLTPSGSATASPTQTPFQQSATTVSQGSLLFFGALLVVLAVVKRFQKQGGVKKEETISILSRKALAPRQALLLVEVEGKKVLLGVSPEQIQLITEFEEPMQFHEGRPEEERTRSFDQTLLTIAPAPAVGGQS